MGPADQHSNAESNDHSAVENGVSEFHLPLKLACFVLANGLSNFEPFRVEISAKSSDYGGSYGSEIGSPAESKQFWAPQKAYAIAT
jgi:hypothetical protein